MFSAPGIARIPIPAEFRGFNPDYCNPDLTAAGYRRNLPHWRYAGATYFTTFRLNDSVPREAAAMMKAEVAAMREKVHRERLACDGKLTATTARQWEECQRRLFRKAESFMDAGHGRCILKDRNLRQWVETSLVYFEGIRCRMSAFVIMPNHVHALVRPLSEHSVENLTGSWKKHSAAEMNRRLDRTGQLWQRETFDRIVRDGDHFRRIVQYIIRNPVKARLGKDEATVWLSEEIRRANGL
ncbi:MAG TPA: transposase [Verrucomicrobiales bacterium]|nr:transposase [Verrucomicrobiales bacterium]